MTLGRKMIRKLQCWGYQVVKNFDSELSWIVTGGPFDSK